MEEYCTDFDATQAAIRAGYSPKTAAQIGHENLRKPDISAAIDARLASLDMAAGEIPGRWYRCHHGDDENVTITGLCQGTKLLSH